MKKKWILICLSLLITASIIGCLNNEENEDEDDKDQIIDIHYEVEITPEEKKNYTIYLPVPLISLENNPRKGEPIKLMEELEIVEGNATWQTIVTEKGPALKIQSKENVIVRGEKILKNPTPENESEYAFEELSMKKEEKDEYFEFYYNSSFQSNCTISFEILLTDDHPNGLIEYTWNYDEYNLTHGWQQVQLTVKKMISDQE